MGKGRMARAVRRSIRMSYSGGRISGAWGSTMNRDLDEVCVYSLLYFWAFTFKNPQIANRYLTCKHIEIPLMRNDTSITDSE